MKKETFKQLQQDPSNAVMCLMIMTLSNCLFVDY